MTISRYFVGSRRLAVTAHLAVAFASTLLVALPMGAASSVAPEGAIVLFDGDDTAQWTGGSGSAAGWNITNGVLTVVPGTGNIRTWQSFEDFVLHLEFRFLTNSPAAAGEGVLHNSGVFLQSQFEIQIMEAYGQSPSATHAGGAVYSLRAPDVNASLPNGQWETYDITFRAARWFGALKTENARVTVYWNDVLVQSEFEITRPTASGAPPETPPPGPISLQDLVGPVQFRNIWVQPLTQPRPPGPESITLVSDRSAWRFLDDGSDQGTAWRLAAFDDSSWSNGVAQFGYGDNDETTLIRSNRVTGTRVEATYFRKPFVVTNAWAITNLSLGVLRDDGAIVYLNGSEVYRGNMTNAAVYYTNWALTAVNTDETRFFTTNVHPALLVNGTNWLVVEVHQQSATSSDVSFDLRLTSLAWSVPTLTIDRMGNQTVFTWPEFPPGFAIESSATVSSTNSWNTLTNALITNTNGFIHAAVPIDNGARFFRLRRTQ